MTAFSACAGEKDALISAGGEGQKKIHDDIAVGNIRCVNISGNARSIVIKQSDSNCFEFINADLDTDNKYEISCEEKDNSLNVCVMMDNADSSNNILGSIVICINRSYARVLPSRRIFRICLISPRRMVSPMPI